MATKIVTKNSSTASAVPTASDLVQGELAVNVADKRLFTEDNGGSIVELGTNPSTLTVTGEITANGGIALGDSDKATFGAGDDLEIYHDGSNSFITDTGTGNLYIRASNELALTSAAGEAFFLGIADGSSYLYHNGSVKLNTTSTGIDITGTATMDGLSVQSTSASATVASFKGSSAFGIELAASAVAPYIQTVAVGSGEELAVTSGGNKVALFQDGGDISFYEDTGTTPKLFWDASAESLGIGTSSPSRELEVSGDGNVYIKVTAPTATDSAGIELANTGATWLIQNDDTSSDALTFDRAGTEAMRIDSSGNVLVGKSDSDTLGTAGHELHNSGMVHHTRATGTVQYLNRTGNDGTIADFRKDGSTVGSIGTVSGRLGIGTGDAGLFFDDDNNKISPVTMASGTPVDSDGLLDLGYSAARFKDLHLSGGARLGPMVGSPLSYVNGTSFTYNSNRGFITSHTTTSGSAGVENGLLLINNDSATSRMSPVINFSAKSASGSYNHSYAQMYGVKTGSGSDSNWNSGALVFATTSGTGPVERMRIDGSGSVSLGVTTPTAGVDGLIIYQPDNYALYSGSNGTGGSNHMVFGNANSWVGSITTNGSATQYLTSSDQRLKENIADADDAGSKIDAIQVRKYDWKADGSHQDYGMIAQELLEVAPEAVSQGETEEEMMGVDYSKLVPMLIKEIQSLRNRVAQLEE